MSCILGDFLEINYSISLSSGEAESGLERLHQCAEKELQVFLNGDGPSKDFNDFRTKLAGLTRLMLLLIIVFVQNFPIFLFTFFVLIGV